MKFATLTNQEMEAVDAIAKRAATLIAQFGGERDLLSIHMDIIAAHTVCPLDLERLARFPDRDFGHDIGGIARHLNRETGELEDCFVPRCAK